MSWAFGEQAALLQADYDLVIATSMTDLSSLRGFVPSLAQIPTILYFHENQFAYPATNKARANVEPQILNLYSALAADKLLFNSEFNYQSFMDGASALLKKLPDQIPTNLIERLKARASVLAVPLVKVRVKEEVEKLTVTKQHYGINTKVLISPTGHYSSPGLHAGNTIKGPIDYWRLSKNWLPKK